MILILLGVVTAVLAAAVVFKVTRAATTETKVETVAVVVATRDIPERTLVPAESLAIKRVPADVVPVGAAAGVEQAVNKMTITRIYPGEIILGSKLADTKGQSGMAFVLEKGKVLMTFPASDIVTTGALRVGDTVDILLTYRGPDQGGGGRASADAMPATTQTTMQNLKIVTMGAANPKQGPGQPSAGSNLITFALDHQDALLLKALKDGEGVNLEVVLRAAGDDQIVKTQPVTMRTILERYSLRSP
jgi:Flp pilus assembly protein CpaB